MCAHTRCPRVWGVECECVLSEPEPVPKDIRTPLTPHAAKCKSQNDCQTGQVEEVESVRVKVKEAVSKCKEAESLPNMHPSAKHACISVCVCVCVHLRACVSVTHVCMCEGPVTHAYKPGPRRMRPNSARSRRKRQVPEREEVPGRVKSQVGKKPRVHPDLTPP